MAKIGGGRRKGVPEKWAEQGRNERVNFGGPRNSLKFSGRKPGARGGVLEIDDEFSVKFHETCAILKKSSFSARALLQGT